MTAESTPPLPIPGHLIISAVRYALGRRTYIVAETCDWPLAHWDAVPESARRVIWRDVEEACRRHDDVWADRDNWKLLGTADDRAQWEQVRSLWLGKGIARNQESSP